MCIKFSLGEYDVKYQLEVLIIKTQKFTISQLYFGKKRYMFRTDLLSIIRSLYTVFTAIGICR